MADTGFAKPNIVARDEWLTERRQLLEREKELTKQYDRVNAQRRRLPMVKVEKQYSFESSSGARSLQDLFGGQRQLIIYHFMFDPAWDKGCMGCTSFVNALGDLSLLGKKDTRFAVVSRAPLAKLNAYKAQMEWNIDWVSSFGSDFNSDFHVTFDPTTEAPEYNYRHNPELKGEAHGLSVFFQTEGEVFHTYSTYARGTESVTDAYRLLDLTPYGRQQEFEDSPAGWPQKPTYG